MQAVLLACARKAPPPKGLFDLKRSVRDDVKAAREVLDGLEGRLPSDTVRDLRQYARETLAQCETETWRDGAGQRPGGRWTEPESASDRQPARRKGGSSNARVVLSAATALAAATVLRRRSTTASAFGLRFCRRRGKARRALVQRVGLGAAGAFRFAGDGVAAAQRVDEGDVFFVVVLARHRQA